MSIPTHITRSGRLRPQIRAEIRRIIKEALTVNHGYLPRGVRIELRDSDPLGTWQPLDEYRPREDWSYLRVEARALIQHGMFRTSSMGVAWTRKLGITRGVEVLN